MDKAAWKTGIKGAAAMAEAGAKLAIRSLISQGDARAEYAAQAAAMFKTAAEMATAAAKAMKPAPAPKKPAAKKAAPKKAAPKKAKK